MRLHQFDLGADTVAGAKIENRVAHRNVTEVVESGILR
jgi:hypothetical protein